MDVDGSFPSSVVISIGNCAPKLTVGKPTRSNDVEPSGGFAGDDLIGLERAELDDATAVSRPHLVGDPRHRGPRPDGLAGREGLGGLVFATLRQAARYVAMSSARVMPTDSRSAGYEAAERREAGPGLHGAVAGSGTTDRSILGGTAVRTSSARPAATSAHAAAPRAAASCGSATISSGRSRASAIIRVQTLPMLPPPTARIVPGSMPYARPYS